MADRPKLTPEVGKFLDALVALHRAPFSGQVYAGFGKGSMPRYYDPLDIPGSLAGTAKPPAGGSGGFAVTEPPAQAWTGFAPEQPDAAPPITEFAPRPLPPYMQPYKGLHNAPYGSEPPAAPSVTVRATPPTLNMVGQRAIPAPSGTPYASIDELIRALGLAQPPQAATPPPRPADDEMPNRWRFPWQAP